MVVVAIVAGIAARPEEHLLLFRLIALISGSVAAVHLVGALERRQPWLETLETVGYAGIAVAAWAFERALSG
jgi:hypothetical protein